MSTATDSESDAGPDLTPDQAAHLQNLQDFYSELLDANADPDTPEDARPWLADAISDVRNEIDDLQAIGYHNTTVDLNAAAEELKSSVDVLKGLKKRLDADAAWVAKLTDVANTLDEAIGTAETLGLTV